MAQQAEAILETGDADLIGLARAFLYQLDERFPNLKVMWIVGPNETQPVEVQGRELTTGAPLWFQVYPSNSEPSVPSSYTTTLALDPAAPNRGYAQNARGNWSILGDRRWGSGRGLLHDDGQLERGRMDDQARDWRLSAPKPSGDFGATWTEVASTGAGLPLPGTKVGLDIAADGTGFWWGAFAPAMATTDGGRT